MNQPSWGWRLGIRIQLKWTLGTRTRLYLGVETGNDADCTWRAGMRLAVAENGNEASCSGEWE